MAFAEDRYERMTYRRCGRSGLMLPAVSLGCWHNFGDGDDLDEARRMLHRAFDLGITHFDLANNYGPPGGSAAGSPRPCPPIGVVLAGSNCPPIPMHARGRNSAQPSV